MSQITLPNPVHLSPVTIYGASPKGEAFEAYLRDIEKAQKTIEIHTFSLSSKKLIELLNKKAREGLEVKIFIDKQNDTSFLRNQLNSKVKVDAISLKPLNVDKGHYHHKTLIVDKKTLWMSSGNFTDACFKKQYNYFVSIKSEKLAQKVQKVLNHQSKDYFIEEKVDGQKIEYWHLPSCGKELTSPKAKQNARAVQRIKELILSAKKTLKIANAYFSHKTIANTIVEASKKGVEVTFFYHKTDYNIEERPEFVQMVEKFKAHGIKCVQNNKKFYMHQKCVLVDQSTFLNGSANWSVRAFKWNDESFLIIHDLKKEQLKFINDYWHRSVEIAQSL